MNKNEENENSLRTVIQQIILFNQCCPSIQNLLFTVENWELSIQNLEKRIQYIQQEVAKLADNSIDGNYGK